MFLTLFTVLSEMAATQRKRAGRGLTLSIRDFWTKRYKTDRPDVRRFFISKKPTHWVSSIPYSEDTPSRSRRTQP